MTETQVETQEESAAFVAANRMRTSSSTEDFRHSYYKNGQLHTKVGIGNHTVRRKRATRTTSQDSINDDNYNEDEEEEGGQQSDEGDNPVEVSSRTLDFSGPKLMKGIHNWMLFFQIIGQVNWHNRPLIFSLIYKILLNAFVLWRFSKISAKLYTYSISGSSFKNPIFIFIGTAAVVTFIAQGLFSLRMSLFDLNPMYKILCTEGLCFVNVSTLRKIGSDRLGPCLLFFIYNALILQMYAHKDFDSFVREFNIIECLMDMFAHFVFDFIFISIAPVDVYLRFAFAHWLLGLKNYLQDVFEKSHKGVIMNTNVVLTNTRLSRQHQQSNNNNNQNLSTIQISNSPLNNNIEQHETNGNKELTPKYITFDYIQRRLNNMDDHLEALRDAQVGVLVAATLNSFLGIGSLTLMTYNLLVDQHDYYHGTLLFITVVNLNILFLYNYVGDEWINHALRTFVNAIESEYFTEGSYSETSLMSNTNTNTSDEYKQGKNSIEQSNENKTNFVKNTEINQTQQLNAKHLFKIRKKDVMFCREFLHQFENHLHTPWTKVTFKGHIHLIRAFFTLMAAQIIFTTGHRL